MLYYNFIISLPVLLFLIVPFSADENLPSLELIPNRIDLLHRERRQLLYPFSTVLQLNIGVGSQTPVNTIQINWAFQANFQLPWNRSQIPVDILHANSGYEGDSKRKKRGAAHEKDNNKSIDERKDNIQEDMKMADIANKYESKSKLYHFYKFVEDVLNGYGYNGSSCVRYALCQLAVEPLNSQDDEDVLFEIATYVLDPTKDNEDSVLPANDEGFQYMEAYKYGLKYEDCLKKYDGCALPLLDMFSAVY